MQDCTDEILSTEGPFQTFEDNHPTDDFLQPIDKNTLNKKPRVKEAIVNALDPEGKMRGEISDDLILGMINSDPFLMNEYSKLFYDQESINIAEGEEGYIPSILDVKTVEDLEEYERFREDKGIPFKYSHLSDHSIKCIYGNPRIRSVVCRLPKEAITDDFVSSLMGKK